MRKCVASAVRVLARNADGAYWTDKIRDQFDVEVISEDGGIIREIAEIFKNIPPELIKACGINKLYLKYLGPNKPYYPNHGYYVDNEVTLNSDIFHHPDEPEDFRDSDGNMISRAAQTLIHEFGHGYDEYNDNLSLKDDWLKLSQWSETPKEGLKRLVIRDKGAPEQKGEWYYHPESEFTRFYAKKNPWDDYADSFAFYVGDIKNKVPEQKRSYFDANLASFFS